MDIILRHADYYVLTPYIYPESLEEGNAFRQIISLYVIVIIGGYFLYLSIASLAYLFLYDHRLKKHPQYLKNQVQQEILYTIKSIPFMAIPTVMMFFPEVRGYSKLYDNVEDTQLGWLGVAISVVTFILFTDMFIYWIHCFLHHKSVYKYLHKDHHRWKVPTPFASHAFHPLDGFLQSWPYHIYPFLFPLHKYTYLGLFVFVNIWTISIHDGNYNVPNALKLFINGSAHHMDHHVFYNYNYGQFFTLWDRIGGTFKEPSSLNGSGPLNDVLKLEKARQNGAELTENGFKKTK